MELYTSDTPPGGIPSSRTFFTPLLEDFLLHLVLNSSPSSYEDIDCSQPFRNYWFAFVAQQLIAILGHSITTPTVIWELQGAPYLL